MKKQNKIKIKKISVSLGDIEKQVIDLLCRYPSGEVKYTIANPDTAYVKMMPILREKIITAEAVVDVIWKILCPFNNLCGKKTK